MNLKAWSTDFYATGVKTNLFLSGKNVLIVNSAYFG